MSETDFATFDAKTPRDRTVMHVLYAMHTVAWASLGTLAVIALILNYIKRSDEHDAVYAAHHNYMISTFWWTLVLFIPAGLVALVMSLTIILLPLAWVPFSVVGFWYLYRCIKGWLRFDAGRPPR
ncbi:MAG: hypothetical protein EOO21_01885 [Comamonadaceae bacterium]|nr:MAG: hypothetical protein EOO21_01885 [Comamonadaceae bacterium]